MVAELDITSNFTFLTGGSHPEEFVERAALLGLSALAIADENSVAGVVRAHAQIAEIARHVRDRAAAEAAGGPIGPPFPSGWAPPSRRRYPGSSQRRKPPVAASRPPPPAPAVGRHPPRAAADPGGPHRPPATAHRHRASP